MRRDQPRADSRRYRWLQVALTAAIAAAVVLAGGTQPIEMDADAFDSHGKLAAANREALEREAILSLVRDHRRSTGDDWRRTLADAIYEESVAASVDPLMVASIVARESSFKSRIVSHRGAVGLMQLRPFVARDVARRGQIAWKGRETLMSPTLNVRLGILYFQELVDRFDGDQRMALTAYNYGPTRVVRQLRTGKYSGSDYADRIIDLYAELTSKRERA